MQVVKGKNKGYGLPADMWSLGCTVLEMLTRQIPYSNMEPVCFILLPFLLSLSLAGHMRVIMKPLILFLFSVSMINHWQVI